ncbi:DUF4432 family protein, partial [Telmatospirillum sp.]|uniref:DUF4432 family protein n=1 Tax=Telmatospirillum sp. TaxID=2079197 RepID=UPI002843CFC0
MSMPTSIPLARLSDPAQVASVHQAIEFGADNRPYRVIDIAMLAGLRVRIMADRGLDITECWYRGIPLHWAGWARESAPATRLDGQDWERHFAGGILTT